MQSTKALTILCIAFLASIGCKGQVHQPNSSEATGAKDSVKYCLVESVLKNGYLYVPKYAFADSVDAVVPPNTTIEWDDKKKLSISWVTYCSDGTYHLVLTPEQIYFYISFENPNPRTIFWAIDIDTFQYNHLQAGLVKGKRIDTAYNTITYKGNQGWRIPKWYKEGMPDSTHEKYCKKELRQQLVKYFADLNRYIPSSGAKLQLPPEDYLIGGHGKFFNLNPDEMADWLRSKYKRRKNKK